MLPLLSPGDCCYPVFKYIGMFTVVVSLLIATFPFLDAVDTIQSQHRVFEVDYANDRFLKDGEPFRYVSGSLHYFRVPRVYWRDRLRKHRAAGLNAVCTYIEWSQHELQPGLYNFSGEKDFEYFIKLAQEEGLLVILRPGPYICAERDFGGYPPWLLHENPNMVLRTNDTSHTRFVYSWLQELLPRLQPLLYGNGGPIIMMQVENEYGSYWACDRNYTRWLRDVFRSYVGDKAVLFTTDGNGRSFLKCGPIPGVFVTVDFGAGVNVTNAFMPLREVQKHGPLVNSEFYAGWLTHWGDPGASTVSIDDVVKTTRELLSLNISFNFYMFHGGTNFGFTSGVNNPPFLPAITSYDYDAPISESGNLTEKYYALKKVISEFMPVKDIQVESFAPIDTWKVAVDPKVSLFYSDFGVKYGEFTYPQTFEALQQYSGFMLYQTKLPEGYTGRGLLVADEVHDRTIVYVNEEQAGILSRTNNSYSIFLKGEAGQTLSLLVENQGHINYGKMADIKGLTKNVTLRGDILNNWTQVGYPLTDVSQVQDILSADNFKLPAFFSGTFETAQAGNAPEYVDMTGWGKGVLYINGHNLGRYWPGVGPQVTLYMPGSILRPINSIVVLELELVHQYKTVDLVEKPIFTNTLIKSFDET